MGFVFVGNRKREQWGGILTDRLFSGGVRGKGAKRKKNDVNFGVDEPLVRAARLTQPYSTRHNLCTLILFIFFSTNGMNLVLLSFSEKVLNYVFELLVHVLSLYNVFNWCSSNFNYVKAFVDK